WDRAQAITLCVPLQYSSSNLVFKAHQLGIRQMHSTTGAGLMCLGFVFTPLVCYLRCRRSLFRGRLTTFTRGASVFSSVGGPPRMTSKASLDARSRSISGTTASSLIIRSRFTTHSKRFRVGDVSEARH